MMWIVCDSEAHRLSTYLVVEEGPVRQLASEGVALAVDWDQGCIVPPC